MMIEEEGFCEITPERKITAPVTIVIFGATGDLTHRKIFPALYNLTRNQLLATDFEVIGVARRDLTSQTYRQSIEESIKKFAGKHAIDKTTLASLLNNTVYCQGDIATENAYTNLKKLLIDKYGETINRNIIYYLATEAGHFEIIADGLSNLNLAGKQHDGAYWRRIIVEKPFGHDKISASSLNEKLQSHFAEPEIFRIDHYLGKDTVQNLLYFRFANSIFEPLWNNHYIDNVHINVCEQVGVGSRGGYYDKSGAVKDMIQNHLFQLMTLVAMEPPATLEAENIRDEKVKVLRSIPKYTNKQLLERSVRGQYIAGTLATDTEIPAYRDEEKVAKDSTTETYAAIQVEIDNWRWAGVPFYLCTGKALSTQKTEIIINFKRPPSVLFAGHCGQRLHSNRLVLAIQPNEGITLQFNTKLLARAIVQKVDMDFFYRDQPFNYFREAYENLLLDVMLGDSTLFTRWDEVAESWKYIDNLLAAWRSDASFPLHFYAPGTTGPAVRP